MTKERMIISVSLFFVVVGVVLLVVYSAPQTPYLGKEFAIEGFRKAKVVGVANKRVIVVLTNNVGQNSLHEMSPQTVQMFIDQAGVK